MNQSLMSSDLGMFRGHFPSIKYNDGDALWTGIGEIIPVSTTLQVTEFKVNFRWIVQVEVRQDASTWILHYREIPLRQTYTEKSSRVFMGDFKVSFVDNEAVIRHGKTKIVINSQVERLEEMQVLQYQCIGAPAPKAA